MARRPPNTSRPAPDRPVWMVGGDDDYMVDRAARKALAKFLGAPADQPPPAEGVEIIESGSGTVTEWIDVVRRVMEAIRTPSLFATRKVVWMRGFAPMTRSGRPKNQELLGLMKELGALVRGDVWPAETALLITGGTPDRALGLVKAVQERGIVHIAGENRRGRGGSGDGAEEFVAGLLRRAERSIEPTALRRFVATVGDDRRRLASETDKLLVFVGDRAAIEEKDVREITSSGAESPIWDLADALGERRLDDALRLAEEFLRRGESAVALLMGLVQRVRLMLSLRPLVVARLLNPRGPYPKFQADLKSIPEAVTARFPSSGRLNPFANHPFVLYKVAAQGGRFSPAELTTAMRLLIEANRALVAGGGTDRLVLQQALIRILGDPAGKGRRG